MGGGRTARRVCALAPWRHATRRGAHAKTLLAAIHARALPLLGLKSSLVEFVRARCNAGQATVG